MRPDEASHEELHVESLLLNIGPVEVVDSPAGPSHGNDEEEPLSVVKMIQTPVVHWRFQARRTAWQPRGAGLHG